MRHLVDGRKFGTNTSHRKAIFQALANNLIRHEHIITTVPKAKELRRVVDRLITLGKQSGLNAKRLAFGRTRDRSTVIKLFGPLAERYAKRAGGYTRVLRVDGTRWGDGAEMALVELVDRPIVEKKKTAKRADKAAKGAESGHKHVDGEAHDHVHPEKKTHANDSGWGKIKGGSAKAAGASQRKTPSKSGGGRSGGGSSS